MYLESLGWNDHFAAFFSSYREQGLAPARVVGQERGRCLLCGEFGTVPAEVAGKFRFETRCRAGFPVVGDWVAASVPARQEIATIHAVLPRRTAFTRNAAGREAEDQILASNIDIVFIVGGLDREFNPRRVERYVVTAWDSGAIPVVVLNKADLCYDVDAFVRHATRVAPGIPILAVSAMTGWGMESLAPHVTSGTTVVLLGSSGVGKSSIVNRLLNEDRQKVTAVREGDKGGDKGRHTTTSRELIALPGGALLIDTPGLRELQLVADDDGLDAAFGDIAALAGACRFHDCRHDREPGCAVKDAVERGELSQDRLVSYQRLQRELRRAAARRSLRAAQVERTRIKSETRSFERHKRRFWREA